MPINMHGPFTQSTRPIIFTYSAMVAHKNVSRSHSTMQQSDASQSKYFY